MRVSPCSAARSPRAARLAIASALAPRGAVADQQREQLVVAERGDAVRLELLARPILRRDVPVISRPRARASANSRRCPRYTAGRCVRSPCCVLSCSWRSACSDPPTKEHHQADGALAAARAADAAIYAPDELHTAEPRYRSTTTAVAAARLPPRAQPRHRRARQRVRSRQARRATTKPRPGSRAEAAGH